MPRESAGIRRSALRPSLTDCWTLRLRWITPPTPGRVVPEFEDCANREVFVFSYRVLYRVDAAAVFVIAVFMESAY